MTILGIVQARTSSTRLPGKVLLPINGKAMILHQLDRIRNSQILDRLVLATSNHMSDDYLADLVSSHGYLVYRGDLDDVLLRFSECATIYQATTVVRLTGDCPLSDPHLIDELLSEFISSDWDYLSNSIDEKNLSVPDGFDIEVFRADSLHCASKLAQLPSEREHVTPWLRSDNAHLNCGHFCHKPFRQFFRVTVDNALDYEIVKQVFDALLPLDHLFGVDAVVDFLSSHPELSSLNQTTVRNEGYLRSLASN